MSDNATVHRRPCRQFDLESLFLVVALIAGACWWAQLVASFSPGEERSSAFALALAIILIPGLICLVVGIVRRKLRFWLTYGIVLYFLPAAPMWLAALISRW